MSYRTKRQPNSKDECPLPSKRRKGRPTTLQEEEEASSLDTQSGSRSDLKIPPSIYNTRITTDAPAELFRKDLISAMKLPDSEQLSTDAYWIISDQWKQEWERGVQVPVNPDSLPGSSVHEVPVICLQSITKSPKRSPSLINHSQHHDFKLPKHKYIRITKDDNFKIDEHQLSLLPLKADQSCSYDMDDLDTSWLKLCNGERSLEGLPKIKEDQFEHVMEELEMSCWEKVQAIIKEEEGLGIEYDENVICDVCRSPDSEDGNEMVFCDNCNICVHQACYGITTIPSGSWLCRTCTLRFRPECVLCPNKNGAMKCTRSGHKWAHVSCALWIPEVSIGCVEKMEPITKISSIPPSRWALICVLCRERVGACIQCSVKTCKTAYHVTCAFKHGLEMRAIIEDESAEDGVKLRSYCQKHSVNSKKDRNSGSEDEDSTKRKRKDMTSEEKNQARAAKLQEIESEFEKHVSVIDVTKNRDVDSDGILFIYNYWVLKRRAGNNRPLLLPKSDDSDLLGRQQEQVDKEKHKMFVQLRQDLERVRNLCYMVSRREKLSRNLLSLREQTFHHQIAVLSDSKLNLSLAEVSAVQEANHGPSIYDRLYSYPDAPDLSTDFETMLSRIAGAASPEKSNYTNLKWSPRENPYKKPYINGSIRYSSMSSSSDLELKPPRLVSSEQSSMDEAKLIKSVLHKHKLKEKRLNKKRSKTKLSTDSSTEEEIDKVKPKWSASPKKLLQIEKQYGSEDSEDVSLPKISSKRPTKVNNIYSDSESELSTKEDSVSIAHTKASVKEFSQGKSKSKNVKDKTTSISKSKELSSEKDSKKTKKDDTKSAHTVPSELIVPQRQAAKKATESIHRVHNKHDEVLNDKKSPETTSVQKKSPERSGSNVKSPEKQPTKVSKIKAAEKLSSVEKESDPQELFGLVPQRQAAKKAIQGIKSGMTKPIEETKVSDPIKKEEHTKSRRSTKSSLSSTSSSSSSSSSSCSSTSSSTSSSSGSSSSDSDTEPEKKPKSIDRVSPLKEISKIKSPPKAKSWLSENKPIKISSSSSSESDKDHKVIRAPDKKLKTSDRRPEHRFQDPPPKREEPRRKSIGSDRCDTVQVITCGDSSVRSDGHRKSSDRDHVGTSTSQSDGLKSETQQPTHADAIENKEIEKKLILDDGDQRILKEDHGVNKNIQEVKSKSVTPVHHTSDKENKKTDELNLYLPGGHRLNDLKDENLLSSSFLTRQDIERELVNNIDFDNKKFSKTPFNCNNHFSGSQRSIFSPQQCNKDIPDFDFDNDMLAVEQAANEEGFVLTRDTDVRNAPLSFTFNNEFFKDDSKEVTARETLNLVEKLRLGITKKSVPSEHEVMDNIELSEPSKELDPPKQQSEPEQKTENTLYSAYNKFQRQPNEVVDVNKVPERDKLDRSESALSDERWVPPSQRSQAESPYHDLNDANRWSDSVVMPSRRSDTSNEPSPEHRDPTTTEPPYQPIHPFPTTVPMPMDNIQYSQYSDPSFILNPPTSNQLSYMNSSRNFNSQQFSLPPPFSTHQSLMPELNKPLHLQTPCTAAFTSSTQNMAFTAAMISPMTHDNFIPPFNDLSMYNDNNLLICAGSNNMSLQTDSAMHNVLNAISQVSNIDSQLSSLPSNQSPRVTCDNEIHNDSDLIPALTDGQNQVINVHHIESNHHKIPLSSHSQVDVTHTATIISNLPTYSQTKVSTIPVTSSTQLSTSITTTNQIPVTKSSIPEVLTPPINQVEMNQNIINQTPVQTPISISQVSNQTAAPNIPTPKQSPALPTTPLPERSPMSVIASSPSVTSSPHPNRTPSDKKSPSKPTRSSSRVSAQSYKSPEVLDRSPEVKKQNKRGPKPQSKTSGRGRGRGRGRSSNHYADYNPAVSKLAGTAYDLDFVEEFGNDNNGVMENLRAMRERKKSDVKAESKSPVSPKVQSSPNNYRRKHASVKELKPPSPIIETIIEDNPPAQTRLDELSPMLPGPVDMRTYNSYDNATSYSDNVYENNTNVDHKETDIVNTLKEDLQNLSKLTSKDKIIEDQSSSVDQIKPVKLPLPVKEPIASSTVLQSESRNQLKVKIKGPFLNAKYNNVQNQPILPTIDTSAISMSIPSHSVPPSEAASVPSNFRQMRKKELLRQYCNQQDNIEQTTNHPIVPPLSRNVITIPKAVASMTTIPTKEDYKAVVDANMEKKRTKYGIDDPKSNYINNIRKGEAITPKLKIKISGDQPIITTMEEKRSLRPPKKRICDTQNDETNHLIAPTMEQLRRDSMKFRRKVFARFEEDDALESTSLPMTPTTSKNKKKRKSSPSASKKKKPRPNKDLSQIQVIEAKESTPKLIIRFSKTAPDEAEVSAVTDPPKATPIKLKISRCKEGYVMKPPSNQTSTDTSLNNNCEVR